MTKVVSLLILQNLLFSISLAQLPVIENEHTQEQKREHFSLTRHTLYLNGAFATSVALFWQLPASFTNWDKDNPPSHHNIHPRWKENIQTPPVWDNDGIFWNWLGHPYVGASLYTLAREHQLSWKQSCVYSFMTHTLLWEYGWEALMEPPSAIDILTASVLGCPLGAGFDHLSKQMKQNPSGWFEHAALFFMNPFTHIFRGIDRWLQIKEEHSYHLSVVPLGRKVVVNLQLGF